MNKYRLLGKEEYTGICDFCGKKHINFAYVVENENGTIERFGSSCIKKALNITTNEIKEMASKEIEKIHSSYAGIIGSLEEEINSIAIAWRKENNKAVGVPNTEEFVSLSNKYWSLITEERLAIEKYNF